MASPQVEARPDSSSAAATVSKPLKLNGDEELGEPAEQSSYSEVAAQVHLRRNSPTKDPLHDEPQQQAEKALGPEIAEDESAPGLLSSSETHPVLTRPVDGDGQEKGAKPTETTPKNNTITHKRPETHAEYSTPDHTARGLPEKGQGLGDDDSVVDSSAIHEAIQTPDTSQSTYRTVAKEDPDTYSTNVEQSKELQACQKDQKNEDGGEPNFMSLGAAKTGTNGSLSQPVVSVEEEGESSQGRIPLLVIHGPTDGDIIDREGARSENIILGESLPMPIISKSTAPRKKTVWLDRTLIFLWFLCCLILVIVTFLMARRLDWNFMSIITAVPIFAHPEGIFQYLAMPLSFSQAKGTDFAVSAIIAPLLIAYANYIWFRFGRRLSNPAVEELINTNLDSTVENFDAGTYDLGKLTGVLKSWRPRNILFAILLLTSALASTLLCNALAYKAIPGTEAAPKGEEEMYYQLVYIPALLFFALCNITIASIAALFLVFNARKAVFGQVEQKIAARAALTSEQYDSEMVPGPQRTSTRRQYSLSLPNMLGFSLPAWRLRQGKGKKPVDPNTRELEPLLPVSDRAESARGWRPFKFPNWPFFGSWKAPRVEAAGQIPQYNTRETSEVGQPQVPVSINQNPARQSAPWKFHFWSFGFPSLSIPKTSQRTAERVPVDITGSRDLKSVPETETLVSLDQSLKVPRTPWKFQFWRFVFPGPLMATYREHEAKPVTTRAAKSVVSEPLMVAESSRRSEEPTSSNITVTESSPLLEATKRDDTSPNPEQKYKYWTFNGFRFRKLDWGQGPALDHSHKVRTRNSKAPIVSNSGVTSNSSNAAKATVTEISNSETSGSWKFPQLQMPNFALALHKHNAEDLESQVTAPQFSKGKETERDLPESGVNPLMPKQTSSWGLPDFRIPEFPTRSAHRETSSTDVYHGASTFTSRVKEGDRVDTAESLKWNDQYGVDWAVKWIDSNDSMETTTASKSDATGPGLGSGWTSQQGVDWTIDWAGQNVPKSSTALLESAIPLPEPQFNDGAVRESEVAMLSESKPTVRTQSQTRAITTPSKIFRTESSGSRGWPFGGMDLPSLKGGWPYEGQSTDEGKGKAKEVPTEETLPTANPMQEQSRPRPAPPASSKSKTSYSWGLPHISLPSTSRELRIRGKGKERAATDRVSSLGSASLAPVQMSPAIQSEITAEGSFSRPQESDEKNSNGAQTQTTSKKLKREESSQGNEWKRWNLGWSHRGNVDTEGGVRTTKVIRSTEPVVSRDSSEQVSSSNNILTTSTTSPSRGHSHHHHHHHHHHQDSQKSKTKTASSKDDNDIVPKEDSDSQKTIKILTTPDQALLGEEQSSKQQSWNEWGWSHFGNTKTSSQTDKSTPHQEADLEAGTATTGSTSEDHVSDAATSKGKYGMGSWRMRRVSPVSMDFSHGSLSPATTRSVVLAPAELLQSHDEETTDVSSKRGTGSRRENSWGWSSLGRGSRSKTSEAKDQEAGLWESGSPGEGGIPRLRGFSGGMEEEGSDEDVFPSVRQQVRVDVDHSYSDFGSAVGINQYLG